jgi:hypothetical protein
LILTNIKYFQLQKYDDFYNMHTASNKANPPGALIARPSERKDNDGAE